MRALRGSRVLADCVVLRNARDMYIFVFVFLGARGRKCVGPCCLRRYNERASKEHARQQAPIQPPPSFPLLVEFRGICCYFVRWVSLTLFA